MTQKNSVRTKIKTKRTVISLLVSSLLIGSLSITGCSSSDDEVNNGDAVNITSALPSHSSSIAITSDDTILAVVNRQKNTVSIFQVRDAAGNDTELLLAEVAVGQEPRYVDILPDNSKAFVTNTIDGSVSVIDLSSNPPVTIGSAIEVGSEPRGIAITPNGKYAYVANHTSGTVSVIRVSSLQVINTINTGGNPQAIAITNDGDAEDSDETVYVTRFFAETIDAANRPDGFDDAKQGVVDHFGVSDSLLSGTNVAQILLAPIDDSGFSADRRQFCLNTRNTLQENGTIFFNSGVNAASDGAAALVKDTFCPDNSSNDIDDNGPIAKNIQGVYPNQLYAAILRNGYLMLPNIGAQPEPPVKFNVNVQALVSVVSLSDNAQVTTNLNNLIKTETQPTDPAGNLERLFGSDIVAIDASADGKQLLIVSRGGNYVIRATLENDNTISINAPSNVVRIKTGNIPSGVIMSSDGYRAYTNNEVSTSVTVINLQSNQVIAQDMSSSEPPAPGSPAHLRLVGKLAFFTALGVPDQHDLNLDGNFDIALRDIEPVQFRGKASDNGWSSCASCHEDGHSDNVTWLFPTGPRQTIALEGTFSKENVTAGNNTAGDHQRILNWNAVRGSVTDFNNNSRGVQGGTGHATDIDGQGTNRTADIFNHGPTAGISDALDAMTTWVAQAVRAPIMPDPEPDSLVAGIAAFQSNCASCHGGESWTKSDISLYDNNPTFNSNPLAANFFAIGKEPALDPDLTVAGPQIRQVDNAGTVTTFLDDVGTHDVTKALEIRGAGAIGGGAINKAGDPNDGLAVAKQSTQGFAPLGGIGYNSPSLLGVAYHFPLLHDGSAETLEDLFNVHTLPVSGNTIAVEINDAATRESLKRFILSIDDDTAKITP